MAQIKQPTFVFLDKIGADVYENGVLIGSILKDGSGWLSERFAGRYFHFSIHLKSYRNAVEIFGH